MHEPKKTDFIIEVIECSIPLFCDVIVRGRHNYLANFEKNKCCRQYVSDLIIIYHNCVSHGFYKNFSGTVNFPQAPTFQG